MKVITSEENKLEFDNGLVIEGNHSQDCCEHNYLDFEQLPVGTELPDMSAAKFVEAITIKEDGFSVKDVHGVPKWVQARSAQNGYYSDGVNMQVADGKITIVPKKPGQSDWGELFDGKQDEY